MKSRHALRLVGATLVFAGALAGCSFLNMVSIDERITSFQSDLNSATRATLYEDFNPDLTADYNALKDPTTTIDPLIPVLGTGDAPYTLTVTDKSSPSTGVFVTIDGGPAGFGAPKYLKLVMETTGLADYRIVSLELSNTAGSFPGPAQIK